MAVSESHHKPWTTGFTHSALLYESDSGYTSTLVPFLLDGLAGGATVAVATSRERISLLRAALGADAPAVRFLPDDEWYVRPVQTIAGWARLLARSAAQGRPFAQLVGQLPVPPPGRGHGSGVDSHPGWVRGEAAINRSLAGAIGHLVCPYDVRVLSPELLEAVRRTHPLLCNGALQANDRYEPPERLLVEVVEPPYPVSGEPVLVAPVPSTISGLRDVVRSRAGAERWLSPDRLEDLLLAVSEVATNGVRHGGGRRTLTLWVSDEAVIGEVTDNGGTAPDPLAGYLPPAPGAIGGMGLWLVHQVCDAFTISVSDGLTRARFAVLRA